MPKRRNVGFLQNQKFDERDVEGAVPYMICVVFIQCNIQQVCGFDGRTMFAPTKKCHQQILCQRVVYCLSENLINGTSRAPSPTKKRPHLGDVLVLFFCSEWCERYACFVEDSYFAVVEPVISCIERFFNGI